MTAVAPRRVAGPVPLSAVPLAELNALFSDAFSERYRRDGMVGVRVPPLHPRIWAFAFEAAGDGAMAWRDEAGALAAFNLAHVSGREGWMGPLAVREDLQGQGVGGRIVAAAVRHLRAAGCSIIGLETMPRTMDNIGFYARRGFLPGRVTVTVTLAAMTGDGPPARLGQRSAAARADALAACTALLDRLRPGADYAREIAATLAHGIGDCLLFEDAAGRLEGFALYHDVPLVEGRALEEVRVLKVALADRRQVPRLAAAVAAQARASGAVRGALRVQGEYGETFAALVGAGARVRWTDLRMHLAGCEEPVAGAGLVLSNWEI